MKRRTFLASCSIGAAATAAGCLSGSVPGGDGEGDTVIWTSFYVLSEVTDAVVGDLATVQNVVPAGQHGHGWEPSSTVQRNVLNGDAFVYVADGFQPWADDVVRTIEEDDADVRVVEARRGVELLPSPESGEHHVDEDDHSGHGERGDHDHGGDPHFWLDPRRLEHAVENVSAGLSEVVPEEAETIEAAAERFRSDLDALDDEFETRLSDRERNGVLVAGHNAFQYLGHRYDVDFHALTGVAPDAEPSAQDVRRVQDLVEEHDLEYVLAPALESSSGAERIVADTDARAVLPITALAGRTDEWRDRGWGYLDVMREVNLTSLARALGAE